MRECLERCADVGIDLLALPDWQVLDRDPVIVRPGCVDGGDERVEFGARLAEEMWRDWVEEGCEFAQQLRTAATSAVMDARSVPLP